MAGEPEAGTVTTEQAQLLLLLDSQAELKRLERDGAFTAIAPNRYWLKDLVQGYVKHLRATKFDTDTATLSEVFGINMQRMSQLSHAGWFKPIVTASGRTKGKYNWIEAVRGYVKFLRDEDRRSVKSMSHARVQEAKALDIEIKTKQRLGQLIPLDVYEEMIDNFSGLVRSEFAGLAAASTRDLTMRRIIEREVNARLRRIAEYAMAQAIRLEANGGVDDAVRADRTGPVGGGQQNVPTNGGGAGST